MNPNRFQIKILDDFDQILPADWNKLINVSGSNSVFITWQWQKVWWEVFGRGKLILVVAEKADSLTAIAPLFSDGGMIFFVGSGGSDYLDFVGDLSDPILLSGMLQAAAATIANFLGFRFYLIPGESPTIRALELLCEKEQWKYFDEGDLAAPFIDFSSHSTIGKEATTKKSLLRHENWFRKNGKLSVTHFTQAEEILPYLDLFFEQHIQRWANTPYPSLFLDDMQKEFYRKITKDFSGTGWLLFSLIFWDSQIIACHFGFIYADSMLWYKPSFGIELSKHSPGEVLIRQLLLLALEKNLKIFDFGLGDESFKMRFASGIQTVKTVGLYPASILTK